MTLSDSSFRKLRKIVGRQRCLKSKEDLSCYAYDATAKTYLPDAVVFPKTSEEISVILKLANKDEFFVVPRGAGSGMTGGSLAVKGGVILVMSNFDRICEIDKKNLIVHVEPGVVTAHLHEAVEKEGLFYPPDPSSMQFSTLGGNLAECAGGPRAVKYGVTRDYVLGLEVVLPTGEIINTGVKTAKGVVGYDLTRLLVGSEGTLGVITRVILKLLPLPESVKTMTAVFDKIEDAVETVSDILRKGLIPRTIEYMDNAAIRCVESYLKTGLPIEAESLLIIETDGKEEEAKQSLGLIKELCIFKGAARVNVAETKKEADAIWDARRAISPALYTYGPDKINEDIAVPKSSLPDIVAKINSLREKTGLVMVSFGHAGDGNIHFNIMLDKKNKEDLEKAEASIDALFDYTLELGGTISGEHGVGITKASYLEKEIGPVELQLMKKIKKVFDPKGILNPGKIFP